MHIESYIVRISRFAVGTPRAAFPTRSVRIRRGGVLLPDFRALVPGTETRPGNIFHIYSIYSIFIISNSWVLRWGQAPTLRFCTCKHAAINENADVFREYFSLSFFRKWVYNGMMKRLYPVENYGKEVRR